VNDLIGGNTHFMLLPANEAIGQVESGTLKAFAVMHADRLPQLPKVPTVKEALGLTTLEVGAWQGLLMHKDAPADIVSKVSQALQRAITNAETRNRITQLGSIMLGGSRQDYANYMRSEGERWGKVARESDAKAD
jgi:tripartite-type tricarboxylate transporter receptor subunit TctC